MRSYRDPRLALPLILALLALATMSPAAELLLNGSFETLGTEGTPEGWSFANWGDARYASGKSVPGGAFGKQAVQLQGTITPVAFGVFTYPVNLSDPHPAELLLTLHYQTQGSPQAEVSLVTFAEDFTAQEWKTPQLAAEAMPLDPSPKWRSVTWRVHVLPAARQAVVLVRIHGAGTLTLDAASLKEYPAEVQCEMLSAGILTHFRGSRECRVRLTNHSPAELAVRVDVEVVAPRGTRAATNSSVTLSPRQARELNLRYSYPPDQPAVTTVRVVDRKGETIYDQVTGPLPGLLEGQIVRPAFRATILPSLPTTEIVAQGLINAVPELREKLRLQARLTGVGVSSEPFAADADGSWQVKLPATGLLAEPYVVVIGASDGKTQIGQLELPLMKVETKAAEVGYDGALRLWVNGQARFPVGLFMALEKSDFEAAAAAGMNTLVLPSRMAGADALETCARLNLSTIISSGNADNQFWNHLYTKNMTNPGVIGWYVLQKPESHSPPAHPLAMADLYGRLRKLDPRRPVCLSLGSVSRLEPYAPWCDVIMPWTEAQPAGDLRSVDVLLQRAMAVAAGVKPVWPVIQLAGAAQARDIRLDPATTGRPPTPDEYRCMVYLALARGANGIFAYPYQLAASKVTRDFAVQRDAPELWTMVTRVGAELQSLIPILLEGEPVAVETADQTIPMRALRYKDATYVLCANPYAQPVPISFKLPTVAGTDLEVAFDQRRLVGPGAGQFGDVLDPHAVRVYMGR